MPNPAQEIDWLLAAKYAGKLTPAARRDILRLQNGEHVDYVIGFSDFLGVKVDLSARPLIPRPETEFWTEKVISRINSHPPTDYGLRTTNRKPNSTDYGLRTTNSLKVLDLFCGSGCIGLAVLKRVPGSRVDLADIEPAYFAGIRKSARWNNIPASRFKTIRSDALKNIKGRYDLILANPPYIPSSGRQVQSSVLSQEPHRALFAGKDGLKFIRPLMRNTKKNLLPGGRLIIEFDPPQKKAIANLAKKYGYEATFHKDQYDRWRWVVLDPRY